MDWTKPSKLDDYGPVYIAVVILYCHYWLYSIRMVLVIDIVALRFLFQWA